MPSSAVKEGFLGRVSGRGSRRVLQSPPNRPLSSHQKGRFDCRLQAAASCQSILGISGAGYTNLLTIGSAQTFPGSHAASRDMPMS